MCQASLDWVTLDDLEERLQSHERGICFDVKPYYTSSELGLSRGDLNSHEPKNIACNQLRAGSRFAESHYKINRIELSIRSSLLFAPGHNAPFLAARQALPARAPLKHLASLSFPVFCDYTQGCHRHTHTIMCCPQSTGSSSISFFNRDRPRWCRPRRGGLSHILSKDFLVIGQVGLQATHSLGSELFSRKCNTLLFNTSLLSVFLSCALPQSVRGSLALP